MKKKILIIVPTLDTGGAQRAVSNMLTNMPDDYDADIVLNDTKSIVYPYKGTIIDLGLKEKKDRSGLIYQAKVFFKRVSAIWKLKKKNKYLAAYSFMDSANFANILTGKKYCKTIVSVRINLSVCAKNNWKYKCIILPMAKALYKFADKVVAVSRDVEYDMVNRLGFKSNNIVTVYNGYNSDSILEISSEELPEEEKKIFDNSYTILMVGRLCKQKAQWHMIRAMKDIVNKKPDVKLVILGEGEYRDYLELLIKQMNLSKNVFLLGFKDNPYKYMKKSDLFVMTSLFEGLPNGLIEALILGVPCIATDFQSGAKEILDPEMDLQYSIKEKVHYGKNGIITPLCDGVEYSPNDPITREESFIVSAIFELINNTELYDKYKQNTKEISNLFSIDKMVEGFLKLAE